MLAEIFLLHLEATARGGKGSAAELELRPVTRVTGRSLLRDLLHLRTLGQSHREIEMLAEIFLLHLEATARGGKGSASARAVESPLFKQRSWAVRTKQLTQAANRLMTHINAISARKGRVITTPLARLQGLELGNDKGKVRVLLVAVTSAAAPLSRGGSHRDDVPAIAPVGHGRPRLVQVMDEYDEKVIHRESP